LPNLIKNVGKLSFSSFNIDKMAESVNESKRSMPYS